MSSASSEPDPDNLHAAAGLDAPVGLDPLAGAGVPASPLSTAIRRSVRLALGFVYYHAMRLTPLDRRLALYAAYWYHGYACNPAALYERARQLVPSVRGLWVVDAAHAKDMPPGVPFVVNGTWPYYRALARARWLINNVNFPNFVVKRRGSIHVQTHHGTPVKLMGLEEPGGPAAADLLRRCGRWDYSISANAHSTEVWSRAYPCRYRTLEVGYPRNDRLARAQKSDVDAVRHLLGIPSGVTAVLYAPTHREYADGFHPLVDLVRFADALGPDAILLVRAHYFYPDGIRVSHPRIRDVSGHPSIEDLMVAADVLVSDYSSVLFDYAVLDRPIVVYAPDWAAYVRTRGVTFDLLAEPPGAVATTEAGLLDVFETGALYAEAATLARATFRARFTYLDDGHAATRALTQIFG